MLTLIPVAPIGKRSSTALACPDGKLVAFTEDAYPESPNGDRLRFRRVYGSPYHSLREFAAVLGIRPSQLSDLEMGRATLSENDWAHVFEATGVPA